MDILWKCIYTVQYKPSKLVLGHKQFLKFMTAPISELFKDVENFQSQYS
jgi:hypothetical protein